LQGNGLTVPGLTLFVGMLALCAPRLLPAAELRQETLTAFENYMRTVESRVEDRAAGRKPFLWLEESAERRNKVRAGEMVIQQRTGPQIPDGLIHDWTGAVFIPGVTLDQVLRLVRDYDRHKNIYKPEVVDSRILHHEGDAYRVYLRLLKKKVITVVLNTEHDVRYYRPSAQRAHSRSYSTRVAEVQNAGTPQEREVTPGSGQGFLWRLNSFWRFEERDGGVYVECEAVSLSRDVPTGLGWLIEPIVRNLPRESLEQTLRSTRSALNGGVVAGAR
jgi:hypothetical protein